MGYKRVKKVNGYIIEYLDGPVFSKPVVGKEGEVIKIFSHRMRKGFEPYEED